ncbi:FCD domain-containing protein [Pseudodesulfovibrio sp. JC047]|uniref:FadR/GntR family transcriptional regulator n=1 Tax=Pseudodesulfovibrio sp. JC047 TaxID=2683199 RepID=UPI0013D244E4|nr:FadR/GntR family transcriptional regulator [Pseudodesulfovibrio sp. JC047]NDV18382.1 FCD domain-containing protein [Pseudodesulfovibrio sp. JC047]
MSITHLNSEGLGRWPSLPEELASIIARQIQEGDFKPGDVLPSETALAKTFSVSRTVVREALARLKFEGILKSKRGSGPVVCDEYSRKIFTLPSVFASDENKADIIEFRLIMEGESAALAAVRRTDEHLAKMAAHLDELSQAIVDKESGLIPDYAFHAILAEAAGNEYIMSFIRFLSARLLKGVQDARALSNQDYERSKLVFQEHKKIYEAIVAKQPFEAREAVHEHLHNSASRQGIELEPILFQSDT